MNTDKAQGRRLRPAQVAAVAAAAALLATSLGVVTTAVHAGTKGKVVTGKKTTETSKAHKGGKKSKKSSGTGTATPPK